MDGSEECGERLAFAVRPRSRDGFTICLRASIRSMRGPLLTTSVLECPSSASESYVHLI